MGVEFRLVNKSKHEKFDLGRGSWHQLFGREIPGFTISEIADSAEDLAVLIHVVLEPRGTTFERCQEIAHMVWNWAQGSKIYFGDDCTGVYDESREDIDIRCPITGSVYPS